MSHVHGAFEFWSVMEFKTGILNPLPQFRVTVLFLFAAEKTAQLQALIIQVEEGDRTTNKHHLVLGGTLS